MLENNRIREWERCSTDHKHSLFHNVCYTFCCFHLSNCAQQKKNKKPCYNISIVVVTFAAQSIEVVRRIALRAAQEKQEGRGRGESVQEGIEEEWGSTMWQIVSAPEKFSLREICRISAREIANQKCKMA